MTEDGAGATPDAAAPAQGSATEPAEAAPARFGDDPRRYRAYLMVCSATLAVGVVLAIMAYVFDLGWRTLPLAVVVGGVSTLVTAPVLRTARPPYRAWGVLVAVTALVTAVTVLLVGPVLQRAVTSSGDDLGVRAGRVWTTGSGAGLWLHMTDGGAYRRLTPDGRPRPAVDMRGLWPVVTPDGERLLLTDRGDGAPGDPPGDGATTAVMDPATGRELYTVDGVGVASADGILAVRRCAKDACALVGHDRTTGAQRWRRPETGWVNVIGEADPRQDSWPADLQPVVLTDYAVSAEPGRAGTRSLLVVSTRTGDAAPVPGTAGVSWAVAGRQALLAWKGDAGGVLVDPAAPARAGAEVAPDPARSTVPTLLGRTLLSVADEGSASTYYAWTDGLWTELDDPFPENAFEHAATDGEWWVEWDEQSRRLSGRHLRTRVRWEREIRRTADRPELTATVASGAVVVSYDARNPLGLDTNSRVVVLDAATGHERGSALLPDSAGPAVPLPGGHGWVGMGTDRRLVKVG